MRRLEHALLVLFLALLAAAPAAHAEKRVALVIGNAKYAHEEQLMNPGNDAREVATALKRIKFDDISVVLDADLIQMQSALARFARKTDSADLALIYYSGHGIEVDGRNYLIPTSAKLLDSGDVDFETVPLDQALLAADRAGKVKIVVLDACRNNPFRARMVRRQGKRSVGRGFAPVAAANGMLVGYSARAGTEADDGRPGGTSPFTTAFLKFVEQPRIEVRLMLGRVRDEVVRTTGRQEPFTYGSLGGEEVFLNAGLTTPPDPPKAAPPPPPVAPRLGEAERAWTLVKDTADIAVLEAFVTRYKDTIHADLARARIADLRRQQLAAAAPPPLAKEVAKNPSSPDVQQRPESAGPILAAPGTSKRFRVEMGKSVELMSQGIILSVRDPDLQKNSIGVRIAGRGSRWGAGQEFPLAPYRGGTCRLALLEVWAEAASFLLRC